MATKRIIPCLDMKDGNVVKGVNFEGLRYVGDPVEMGRQYCEQGADELVFLDIAASFEGRKTFVELVKKVADVVTIPLAVGGGIGSVEDVEKLLNAGVSKVSINSAALKNPQLIEDIAKRFGTKTCVCAIDAQYENDQKKWVCYINGGRVSTGRELTEWAKEAQERGAGEVLFTSMSHDGVKTGFPNDALLQLHNALSIPVIASGGAGKMEDFKTCFLEGKADAALAASVFHFGEVRIPELKQYLRKEGIEVK